MPPLNRDDIQQLTAEIQKAIVRTDFACSSLTRVSGGSASFIFRAVLKSPLSLCEGSMLRSVLKSVIVKKATEFAAVNRDFALDSGRSTYESAMLSALSSVELGPGAPVMGVFTPRNLLYLPSPKVQIIEDVHPALDCASLFMATNTDLPLSVWSVVGLALGEWLHALHHWTQEPAQSDLRNRMERNVASRDLKWRTTHATIVDIATTVPAITEEHLDVLREVRARAEREHEEAMQGQVAEGPDLYGIVHGDFWTGNVLLTPPPQPRLHVIDFEFSHHGHRAMDLGQFIGDLLEKILLAGAETSTRIRYEVMIEAFAKGYGTLSDDMAYRVIIHAGVHVVNWCARHPDAEMGEQVALMMREAVEVIVRAWRRERKWFEGRLPGCLFATPM